MKKAEQLIIDLESAFRSAAHIAWENLPDIDDYGVEQEKELKTAEKDFEKTLSAIKKCLGGQNEK